MMQELISSFCCETVVKGFKSFEEDLFEIEGEFIFEYEGKIIFLQ